MISLGTEDDGLRQQIMFKLLHAQDLSRSLHGAWASLAHKADRVVGPHAQRVHEVACNKDTRAAQT